MGEIQKVNGFGTMPLALDRKATSQFPFDDPNNTSSSTTNLAPNQGPCNSHRWMPFKVGPTGRKRWMVNVSLCVGCGVMRPIGPTTLEQRNWLRRSNRRSLKKT